jgi:hypothetical protein
MLGFGSPQTLVRDDVGLIDDEIEEGAACVVLEQARLGVQRGPDVDVAGMSRA